MSEDRTSTSDQPSLDMEAAAKQLVDVTEKGQQVAATCLQRQIKENAENGFSLVDPMTVSDLFANWTVKVLNDPTRLQEAQLALYAAQARLWQTVVKRAQGDDVAPVIEPEPGDRRFKDKTWQDDPFYDYLKQSYLLSAKWLRDLAGSTADTMDPKVQARIDFYMRQFISAASPSNLAAANPLVMKKAEETGGQSLLDGLHHWLDDLERGDGRLKISMTDEAAFEVGKNVATTPGKVVYQNDLMQLIQYEPTTEKVYKRPLLIVPPWINKFYILDLQPKNSFIKHAIDQGHTVFVVSWANPDKSLAAKGFGDYMTDGPLAALDAIEQATGERTANILGFCIGGILVSATLAHLTAKGDADRVGAATFLTTMFDFEDVGEASVFIDEAKVAELERHVAKKGYLEGRHMADMFSMMRENDLIWSFFVNNYLMGREPMAFDLLYWNADNTRLPAAMIVFYLREMYLKNRLKEPGGITLAGTPIDLTRVKTPIYFMAAKEDHIAPWRSCYPGTQLFAGPKRFVLAASGHVAGVVNPPSAKKYGHWTFDKLPAEAKSWLGKADWHEGSWWPDWYRWLGRRAGKKVPSRTIGDGKLKPIEDAPG
ncbi:MAG: class I poly(R)-hydroxyalkanoic acid synthase, partial [Pseudomonadota bacterium]